MLHVIGSRDGLASIFNPVGKNCDVVVALDVEWTKNYRIKNGQHPFCFSLVRVESENDTIRPERISYYSAYCGSRASEQALLLLLDDLMAGWSGSDITLAGHQLSTDLAVATRSSVNRLEWVESVRSSWHDRRATGRIVDTRYDLAPDRLGESRRLVDVCTDLGLDVYQPELLRHSMTSLHRNYLTSGDESIRERLTTLNLRHSLSTAILAIYHRGASDLNEPRVNTHVHRMLSGKLPYVDSEYFMSLVGG